MPKKLLVADDSVTIQKVISLAFAGEDVVVESVTSGDQALSRVREVMPDIVLADIFMPGQTGYEVCANIKEDPQLSSIPVVLLVGTFEPFDESEASRVKCDGYLTKPFDTTELLQLFRSLTKEKGTVAMHSADEGAKEEKQSPAPTAPEPASLASPGPGLAAPTVKLVSDRTRESFLGSHRILDLFGVLKSLSSGQKGVLSFSQDALVLPPGAVGDSETVAVGEPLQLAPGVELTEDALNAIVDRVLRRISDDVIREVAWEVVPEMSEIIIRQCLEEKGKI